MNDDLRRRFDELGDDELLRRYAGDALTDDARAIVLAVLRDRGIQPPAVADDAGDVDDTADEYGGDIVTVRRTFDLAEAHMLQSVLEEEGIAAWVADADLHRNLSHLTIGLHGIRVQVRAARLADAQRVLAALQADEYKLADDDEAETTETVVPGAATAAEMGAFTRDDGYVKTYVQMRDRGGRWAGMNFPVLFFGGAWFFYRRLYVAGILYVIAVLALMDAIALIDAPAAPHRFDAAAYLVALLALRVVSVFVVDTYYLRRAVRIVLQERARLAGDALLAALRRRGGTSLLAVGVYLAVALGQRILMG